MSRPQLTETRSFADVAAELETQPPQISEPAELKEVLSKSKLKKLTAAVEKKNGEGRAEAELRRQAVLQIGETADSRAAGILIPLAADYWISVREGVAEALGNLRDPAGVPTLVRLLGDEVPDVKRDAVVSLGKVGDARAVRPLLDIALQEPLFRFTAGEAVTRIGKAAVPILISILKEDDPGLALEAIIVLGRIKDPAAVEPIAALLGHRFAILRSHAAESLGHIGDAKSATALIRTLGDPDAVVRAHAAAALQKLGDKRAVPALTKLLEDDDLDVCCRAAVAIGELGGAEAAAPLLPLLERAEPELREAAADALGKLGNEIAAQPLTLLFHDAEEAVRLKAVSAFRKFRSATSAAPLLTLLDDGNTQIRQRAVDALGEIGNLGSLDRLLVTLRSDSAVEVRMAAAKALGLLRSPRALKALEESLDDDLTVRCRAITALGDIGDASCLPALLAMLRDPTPEVRYHASQSLGAIGHQNSRKPLEELLGDDNAMVRRGAAKALVKLGDPRGEKLIEQVSAPKKPSATERLASLAPDWLVGLVSPHSAGGQLVIAGIGAVVLLGGIGYFAGPSLKGMFAPAKRMAIRGKPTSVGISVDGRFMLTGRSRGSAEVWDIAANRRVDEIVLPSNSAVTGVAMSPDGNSVYLTAGPELYQYASGKLQPLPAHPQTIRKLVVSSDGKRGATYSKDGTVYVINLETGKVDVSLLLNAPEIVVFNFSADAAYLAWGTTKGEVFIFDVAAGAVVDNFRLHTDPCNVTALAFGPDGKQLVAAGGPARLFVRDFKEKKDVLRLPVEGRGKQSYAWMSFTPDGAFVLGLSGRDVEKTDLAKRETAAYSLPQMGVVEFVAMGPKAEKLAAAGTEEDAVWVVDLVGQKLAGTYNR